MSKNLLSEFEGLDCNTGILPGLTFEEALDRYFDKMPIKEQKDLLMTAYRIKTGVPKKAEKMIFAAAKIVGSIKPIHAQQMSEAFISILNEAA